MNRLPPDAFVQYVAMGERRSYQKIAHRYGVSKRSVVSKSSREGWQRQLREIETAAQAGLASKLADDLVTIRERHLRTARVLQSKALESIKSKGIGVGQGAVKALLMAQREERDLFDDAGPSPVRARAQTAETTNEGAGAPNAAEKKSR